MGEKAKKMMSKTNGQKYKLEMKQGNGCHKQPVASNLNCGKALSSD